MNLTAEEKNFIQSNETMIESILSSIQVVQQFKDGDFLIAFHKLSPYDGHKKKRPVTNSYGAVKKFQVVAVDKHGVPYMKELNKKGKPVGRLISSIEHDNHGGFQPGLLFEVDPDFADAIILEDQANFNASNILKEKSDTFKEIALFNKNIKVDCQDIKKLATFLSTIKVGDLLWRSNISSWTVQEVDPLPRDKGGRIENHKNFMKVTTNKGKEEFISFWDIKGKALYTDRPRSYKELKDPK